MKPKEYEVLRRAIEEGVAYGYTRAFKYTVEPTTDDIVDCVVQHTMNSVCEWFTFDDIPTEP